MKKTIIYCPFLLLFLASCASNIQSLQRESARNIGNGLKPNDITITNIKRGAKNVNWEATTLDGTIHSCNADDMVRRINCTK